MKAKKIVSLYHKKLKQVNHDRKLLKGYRYKSQLQLGKDIMKKYPIIRNVKGKQIKDHDFTLSDFEKHYSITPKSNKSNHGDRNIPNAPENQNPDIPNFDNR